MIYRYTFVALIASISLILMSAGVSVESAEISKFIPTPPFSGGPGTGGLGDRTGSPLSSGTCSACHSGGSFSTNLNIAVFDGPTQVVEYTPGSTYTVIYTVTGTASGYGVQGTALTNTNAAAGSFSSPSANAQLVTISGRPYFEHDNGASATGVFQTTWTAPAANTGNIIFYGVGLGANGNGGTSGDEATTTGVYQMSEAIPTTVDYPGTPFCSSLPTQTPTLTGELTGTYSSTLGLSINPSTGDINVSTSTPGTYTVSYTYSTGVTTASVTINESYTSSSAATICNSETLTFGTQVLDASNAGLNTEVFQAMNGCDSTVNLTLNVLPTYTESATETICAGDTYDFNGQILTDANAGLNTTVFQAMNGCDSTVNLTLNVDLIDNTVTLAGGVITSNQAGATYQWLDCDNGNTEINGETNSSYSPTMSGNYAVEITINNCTEISACTNIDYSSLNELNLNSAVVFPNPVTDVFEIKNIEQLGTINFIFLMDANGKMVVEISVNDSSTNIEHLEKGVYFLRIVSESGESIISVVKK